MHTHAHTYIVSDRIILLCRKKLYFLACVFIILASPAISQPTEPTTDAEIISTPIPTESEEPPLPPGAPKPAKPKPDTDIEEVMVVGSRIRRDALKSISPLIVMTPDDLRTSGSSSLTEFLQSNKVTGGASQINNAYGGYVTDGGPGSNTISLRGLGASRTLVLINGRRVAPAGTRGAVGSADLNVLPTAMIERIEVLKDGASSIYGSDAIGGVINVITLESVDGITLDTDVSIPTEGEGEQYRFSISGGYSEERLSISGSFDYMERKNLTLGDRDWTKCNTDNIRDPETGESLDYIDPRTGKPKCYPITGDGSNGVTVNTIGTFVQSVNADNWEELGLNGPPVGAPGTITTSFTRFRPNSAITTGLVGYEGVGGGGNGLNVRDTFDPRMLDENLISPVKVYTSFIQGIYDLQALGNAELYVELLANRRDSRQTSFRQLTMDYRRGSPLIPDILAFGDSDPTETSDGDPVGIRAFIGFGNDKSTQTVDFIKPTFGIKGDLEFLPDWKYDIYANYSKSDAEYTMQSFLTDKLTYASDVVVAPDDINPSLVKDGLTCEVNLTDTDERCIPFPALTPATVGGSLPQDFKDYIFREVLGSTLYEETVVSAIIDGPLLEVPAGEVQSVFGYEYREAEIDDTPDPNSISGNLYNLTVSAPTKGSDSVKEVYTEIEIPVLNDVPFVHELIFNGSLRYTDYDSYGSDDTYKVGLVYSPIDWLSLRGTRGTSFRAPALFEQFQGATSGFLSAANDPCNDYGTSGVSQTVVDNCSSELPGQPDFQNTSGVEVFSVGGADAGLHAETSDNITYGIVLKPPFNDAVDLTLEIDYFDIHIDNSITKAGATEILDRCYSSPDFETDQGFCRLVTRDPSTAQLSVSNAYINLATQDVRGLDITMYYEQGIGSGSFSAVSSFTRYYEQSEKLFSDDDVTDFNGNLERPEFSADLFLAYTINDWRVAYGINWIASMDSYDYLEEVEGNSIYDFEVPSYIEHRVSLRYRADNWETTFGIRNLTNEIPPSISFGYYNRVGNAPLYSGYDYVGREAFVNVQWRY